MTTEKLGLEIEVGEEFFNVEVFNSNFKKIDDFAKTVNELTFDTLQLALNNPNMPLETVVTTLGEVSKNDGKGRKYIIKSSADSSNIIYTSGKWFNKFILATETERGNYNGTIEEINKKLNTLITTGTIDPIEADLEETTNKGVANGYAPLNSSAMIPSEFLPSYVDDIVEGFYHNLQFYKEIGHLNLISPELSKIYVDITNDGTNQYRWSGSSYIFTGTGQLSTETTNGLMSFEDKKQINKFLKFNKISDVQAYAEFVVGDVIEVLGYYEKGDGGGHRRKKNPVGSSYEWEILSAKELGYADIRWYGCSVDLTAAENTLLIQRALLERVIKIPSGKFKLNEITINTNLVQIIGEYSNYCFSQLEYQGTGTFITFGANVGNGKLVGIRLSGTITNPTDYYKTGTVLCDYTAGNTSIEFENCWLDKSEILCKQNYNGFYNKFINCRMTEFKTGLHNFNGNNLIIERNRVKEFNTFLLCNNYFGSLDIERNSFEVFNGNIVQFTGAEQGTLNFKGNYVEDYHLLDLPTNFPLSSSIQFPNKFGGQNLFSGHVGNANIEGNSFDIGGSYSIAYFSSCRSLISKGNRISGYAVNNGLYRLYDVADTTNLEHVEIHDISKLSGTGPFTSTTYNQPLFEGKDPYIFYEFYDCITKKDIYNPKTLIVPTLKNGWTLGSESSNNPLTVKYMKDGIYFQGVINGTNKTDNVILETNPTITEKFKNNNTSKQFNHKYFTSLNSTNELVIIRFLKSVGALRLENSPVNLSNIFIEFFIPYNN